MEESVGHRSRGDLGSENRFTDTTFIWRGKTTVIDPIQEPKTVCLMT